VLPMACLAGRSSQNIELITTMQNSGIVCGRPLLAEAALHKSRSRAREPLAFQGLQVFAAYRGIVPGSTRQFEGGASRGPENQPARAASPVLAVGASVARQSPRLADLRGVQAACRRADELAPVAEICTGPRRETPAAFAPSSVVVAA